MTNTTIKSKAPYLSPLIGFKKRKFKRLCQPKIFKRKSNAATTLICVMVAFFIINIHLSKYHRDGSTDSLKNVPHFRHIFCPFTQRAPENRPRNHISYVH